MFHTGSFRFAARPKWIVGHVLALLAVIGFINLGFWQLRRHDERSIVNARIEERIAAEPRPLEELLATYGPDPGRLEYRRVRIAGEYMVGEELLWQARTHKGRSGHDVLTPMDLDGQAVIVDRGWVPIDAPGPPVPGAEPPPGQANVVGVIRRGRVREGLGPIDPATGDLDRVSRVDIGRIQQQVDVDLLPFYVLLVEQSPPQPSGLPLPQDPPSPDSGPHLSYAIQWFIFSVIAAIGYPVLLVRTARDERRSVTVSGQPADPS